MYCGGGFYYKRVLWCTLLPLGCRVAKLEFARFSTIRTLSEPSVSASCSVRASCSFALIVVLLRERVAYCVLRNQISTMVAAALSY